MITADGEAPRRAILIEDDDGVRRSLQLLLHWHGFDVRSFASALRLLGSPLVWDADVLVADYRLPDGNGIDVLRELRRQGWSGRSVLITAFPSDDLIREAKESGYDTVLVKPLREQALIAALAA
ncbi:MAG: response regulator [Candidatus Sphingomonas colombiensis]|nr:response regulator [Sphingomonas sp.]WEK45111.1 MAG: response regulator [Sphingomonas sp.]